MSLLIGTVLYLAATFNIAPNATSISAAGFPNGNFVLAWTNANGIISTQLINPNGGTIGQPAQLTNGTMRVLPPAVSTWLNGNYLVVWQYLNPSSNTWNVEARGYFGNGTQLFMVPMINSEAITNPMMQGPMVTTGHNGTTILWCQNQENCQWFTRGYPLGSMNATNSNGSYTGPFSSPNFSPAMCSWLNSSFLVLTYFSNTEIQFTVAGPGLPSYTQTLNYQPQPGQPASGATAKVVCMQGMNFVAILAYPTGIYNQMYSSSGVPLGSVNIINSQTNKILGINGEMLGTGYLITYITQGAAWIATYNSENLPSSPPTQIYSGPGTPPSPYNLGIASFYNNSAIMVAPLFNNMTSFILLNQINCSTLSGLANSCPMPTICQQGNGECVQCLVNQECPNSAPSCINNKCQYCRLNSECPSSTPVCYTRSGTCVSCLKNSDCNGELCVNYECAACGGNSDCANNEYGPFCNYETGQCMPCLSNLECHAQFAGMPYCNFETYQCVTCINNAECPSELCILPAGQCEQCNNNNHCTNNEECCSGTCQQSCPGFSIVPIFIIALIAVYCLFCRAKKEGEEGGEHPPGTDTGKPLIELNELKKADHENK